MEFLNNALHAAIYFAGLYDGEGSVGLYRMGTKKSGQKYATLSAKLTNSDKRPLVYVLDMFGGYIENNRASEKHTEWQDTYSWRVYSDKAHSFLNWILPYTIIKNEQIIKINEFWVYYQEFRQNKHNRPDDLIIDRYIQDLKNMKRGK